MISTDFVLVEPIQVRKRVLDKTAGQKMNSHKPKNESICETAAKRLPAYMLLAETCIYIYDMKSEHCQHLSRSDECSMNHSFLSLYYSTIAKHVRLTSG